MDARRPVMRRYRTLLIVGLAAAATGCLYGREPVRDDRRIDTPPPPPPVADYSTDSGYSAPQSYQNETPPPPAGSDVSSEAVFYERLSPYGYWMFVAPYGRVWVPAVGYGWRPYYYGQWVLTDWGWTFVSDDPWGWAAYHYGRWNFGVGVGWYWVPGRVWGPAWVNWRYGAGYVTWCPLGPPGVVFGYRHPAWVAVPEQHFTRPIATVAIPGQRTYGAVAQANPLSGPHATFGRGGSFGPPVTAVARATGQQIRPTAVTQVVRPRPAAVPQPGAPLRSPVQPRRVTGAHPIPSARPGAAPQPVPVRPGPTPSRIESGPPAQGGGPSAAPPSGGSAPRAAPPAASAPHAGPSSGGGGGNPPAPRGRTR